MKKHDYLLKALADGKYRIKHWVISAFSLIREGAEDYKKDPYPYRIIQSPTGFQFVDPDNGMELTKIDDADPREPLFRFTDPIKVDQRWALNIDQEYETTIGRVFVNAVTIADVFKDKIPFHAGPSSVRTIEAIIAPKLKDTPNGNTPREKNVIYVDEYSEYVDRLQYIASLANLSNWSATRKNIKSAPGIRKFRDELAKQYGDKLKDPAYLVEFETQVKKYDAEYMKGDPSDGVFTSGKIKDIARRKMFIDIGVDSSFRPSTTATPILTSLEEEWPTDPEGFASMMNGLRYGSYARGMETVNGGVTAKSLLRSLGSFTINDKDCGTKEGLTRVFNENDYDRLEGRYVLQQQKWVLIPDNATAKTYINKPVILRTPIYCHSPKESFCRYCVGEKIALNPNGLSLAAADVSAVILASFMKSMHGKVLASAHFDYQTGLS